MDTSNKIKEFEKRFFDFNGNEVSNDFANLKYDLSHIYDMEHSQFIKLLAHIDKVITEKRNNININDYELKIEINLVPKNGSKFINEQFRIVTHMYMDVYTTLITQIGIDPIIILLSKTGESIIHLFNQVFGEIKSK